jgi:phospholipid/cholesterol/gamma-HCH transport system permease protein
MNASGKTVAYGYDPQTAGSAAAGITAAVGQWVIANVQGLIRFISIAAAVMWHAFRPLTWRRTVRAAFVYQCHQVGTRALPFIMITGVLVGMGIVFETLYWLKVFGQTELAGDFLVVVLVREIAPLLVALIVIGRSVSVILVELGGMAADGQVRMLDAQGIDPFIYLLMPRVMAVAVCTFCLAVMFIAVTLGTGFIAGNMLNATNLSVYDFIFNVLSSMGPGDFAIIPLKTLLTGFTVALIGCTSALSFSGSSSEVSQLLPAGIMKCVLAMLLISGMSTLLLL